MSQETEDKIAAAIAEHVTDAWDGESRILTDWIVCAAHFGETPGQTGYVFVSNNASPHVLTGLVRFAEKRWEPNPVDKDD